MSEKASPLQGIRLTPGDDLALKRPHHTQQFRVGPCLMMAPAKYYPSGDLQGQMAIWVVDPAAVGMGRGEAALSVIWNISKAQSSVSSRMCRI